MIAAAHVQVVTVFRKTASRALIPHALKAAVEHLLRRRPGRAFVLRAPLGFADLRTESRVNAVLGIVLSVSVRAGFAPPSSAQAAGGIDTSDGAD